MLGSLRQIIERDIEPLAIQVEPRLVLRLGELDISQGLLFEMEDYRPMFELETAQQYQHLQHLQRELRFFAADVAAAYRSARRAPLETYL